MPRFWVSGHRPGAPATVSDRDGLDAKPTTWEPGQSWEPLSVPALEDTFLRGFGLVYKHVKIHLGWGCESCSCPAESKRWHNPHKIYLRVEIMTASEKTLIPTAVKTTSALGEGVCSTISLHSAWGLYSNRPCLPRDIASGWIIQNLHSFFTFSVPAKHELTRQESTEWKRSRSPVQARRSWDTAARSTRRRRIVLPLPVGKDLQLTRIFPRRNRGFWLVPSGR